MECFQTERERLPGVDSSLAPRWPSNNGSTERAGDWPREDQIRRSPWSLSVSSYVWIDVEVGFSSFLDASNCDGPATPCRMTDPERVFLLRRSFDTSPVSNVYPYRFHVFDRCRSNADWIEHVETSGWRYARTRPRFHCVGIPVGFDRRNYTDTLCRECKTVHGPIGWQSIIARSRENLNEMPSRTIIGSLP